ncbi:MAG TPA: solute carrier family 23 protein [Thermodesulfobacteriota bacterium]
MTASDARDGLVYRVDDAPRSVAHWFIYTGQWVVTMVYAAVWGYAVVGRGLALEGADLVNYMVRIVFLTGICTLAQASVGHRFAMVSGPNIIPSLAILVAASSGGRDYALQSFTAQAVAGVVVLALALTGALRLIERVFSPLVLGAMITTVGLAVAGTGLEQMTTDGFGWPFWAALGLALGAVLLSIRGTGVPATLPTLLVIAGGYVVFGLAGALDTDLIALAPTVTWPRPFAFGLAMPPWDLTVTMLVVALMSALNLYGNVQGYAAVVGETVDADRRARAFTVFGAMENVLAGIFAVPAYVPYGENIGIVMLTRVAARLFIVAAAIVFAALAFIGPVAGLMAAMPLPVSGAVLLGIASTVIGLGAQTWLKAPRFESREIAIVGFAVFLALGLSLLPEERWEAAPRLVATVFSNPVVSVILFVVCLERILLPPRGGQRDAS